MATFNPAFRLTVFAPRSVDPTEATILTPVAGAPHSDQFKVTTLSNLAGWKPYLGLPSGRTGRLDVLTKRTDIGTMRFRLLDPRTTVGGSNFSRWLTAYLGDTKGLLRMLGLKAFAEESLILNADGTRSDWVGMWTGRVQRLAEVDKQEWDLELYDMREDLKALAFVSSLPHVNVQSYAGPLSLLPVGSKVAYGTLVPPAPLTGKAVTPVIQVNGSMSVAIDSTSQANRRDNLVTQELLAGMTNGPWGWPGSATSLHMVPQFGTPLRVALKHTSGANSGLTGTYKLGAFLSMQRADGTSYVTSFFINALDDASEPGFLALPANNVTVEVQSVWHEALTADTEPMLVNDAHPVQLIKDLASGYFGWLYKAGEQRPAGKNIGDPKRSVTPNAAAFATLIADTSFPTARLYQTETQPGSDVIETLCQDYQVGYYFDGSGQFTPVDLRLPTTAPVLAITDADVVASATGSPWEADRSKGVQRVSAKYYYDYLIPVEQAAQRGTSAPAVKDTFLKPVEALLEVLDVGPYDIGDQRIEIDGRGYRYMDGETVQGVTRAQYELGQLTTSARTLTQPLGSGSMVATLTLRRTSNTAQLNPGTLCLMTVSWLPDPFTNLRGGTRVMRCIAITRNGATLQGEFLDYGSATTANVPVLGAVAAVGSHAATVVVTLNAQADPVELHVAITATSVGVAPATNDPAWHAPQWPFGLTLIRNNGTFGAYSLPAGMRIWFRARSRPGGYNRFQQPSAWVVSSSVDLPALAAPSALVISAIGSTKFTASWTVGDPFLTVQILLSQPNGQPYQPIAELPPGSTTFDVIGVDAGTTVGIRVQHADSIGGVSAFITTTVVMLTVGNDAALPALATFNLIQYG